KARGVQGGVAAPRSGAEGDELRIPLARGTLRRSGPRGEKQGGNYDRAGPGLMGLGFSLLGVAGPASGGIISSTLASWLVNTNFARPLLTSFWPRLYSHPAGRESRASPAASWLRVMIRYTGWSPSPWSAARLIRPFSSGGSVVFWTD